MRLKEFRRAFALSLLAAAFAATTACEDKRTGVPKVLVIGGAPQLRDPYEGPLKQPDRVMLMNVAQGLVRFDAAGNIVGGVAERWNVSDDGLSYIFRLSAMEWPDGSKVTAQQVARMLKRQLTERSRNPLRDTLGAVEDIVPMTERVIEIRLIAPRPNLLPLLAQPELGLLRNTYGTGPFSYSRTATPGQVHLLSEVISADEEVTRREEVLLNGAPAPNAVKAFTSGDVDLVLGGTAADLPIAKHSRRPRNSLRFDPASGLFGLIPLRDEEPFADEDVRRLLSEAIDRDAFVAALDVPGLVARATVLEPGLDGIPGPVQPAWFGVPLTTRRSALQAEVLRLFGKTETPTIRVFLPAGPGMDILFSRLVADWGAIGFPVERASSSASADFGLIDEVAPSNSPAWFLRKFRCVEVPICDNQVDDLLAAARTSPVAAQRYALLYQAGERIDSEQLFIPITAPVRWSLVSSRITGFAGNRYALHTLTDLDQRLNNRGE